MGRRRRDPALSEAALSEYVRERLDRIRGAPPRRARPELTVDPDDPPLPEPWDEPWDEPGIQDATDPDPGGAPSGPPPAEDEGARPGRVGAFVQAHAVVVALVCLVALGVAGYAVLRARPVPLTLAAQAQPLTTPAPSGSTGGSLGSTSPRASATGSTAPASKPAEVVVHVLGAVRRPGVVHLPSGSRVTDAIAAAGGLSTAADPAQLNLAQVLADGQQILVGTRRHPAGEVRTGTASGSGSSAASAGSATPSGSGGASGSAGEAGQPVDLNTATAAELDQLPGVGPVTAASIIAWREQHGRFSRIEELQEIDGIGPKTFARLAPHVRV